MATLQALLACRGVTRPCELAEVLECSRQMGSVYWQGGIWRRDRKHKTRQWVPLRLGREVATRLATRLDLPVKALLLATWDPPQALSKLTRPPEARRPVVATLEPRTREGGGPGVGRRRVAVTHLGPRQPRQPSRRRRRRAAHAR